MRSATVLESSTPASLWVAVKVTQPHPKPLELYSVRNTQVRFDWGFCVEEKNLLHLREESVEHFVGFLACFVCVRHVHEDILHMHAGTLTSCCWFVPYWYTVGSWRWLADMIVNKSDLQIANVFTRDLFAWKLNRVQWHPAKVTTTDKEERKLTPTLKHIRSRVPC